MPGFSKRYRFIVTAFLKGVCLVVPLILISIALKLSLPYPCESVPCLETQFTNERDQPTFYFIGTSRVQRSISPAALKADLPDYNFINIGLSNNSFLYSCKTASNLLKQNSGKKIIFIELSGLTLLPSDSYHAMLTIGDVGEVLRQYVSVRCTPEDMSGLLFFLFSIHGDIKKVVYPRLNLNGHSEIGFLEETRDSGSLEAMLTPKSFVIKTKISRNVLDKYMEVIHQLRKEAEENGSEIQFILPLTIWEESEFDIDMAVFDQLPDHMKWSYSDEFLKAMYNSQYLSDELHLNSKGAAVYSRELSGFIRERFTAQLNE